MSRTWIRQRHAGFPAMSLSYWRYILFSSHSSTAAAASSSSNNSKVPVVWDYFNKPTTTTTTTNLGGGGGGDAITVQLFSWGHGASGQLGGGIEEIRLYPAPVASLVLPPSFRISHPIPGCLTTTLPPSPLNNNNNNNVAMDVGIFCGLFHSALLVDGNFWIWGKGDGGRLGFGHENSLFFPTLNPNLDCIRRVALGGLHSVALNSLGQVFTWGYGGFGALGHSVYHRELLPRLVEGSWEGEICHIATSGTHTAAITKSGELYTWGRDEGEGRLGLGPGRGPSEAGGFSIPSKVKALPVPVAAVSCGGFFTMAVTDEGQLWNWGANSNYELGRGDKIGGWQPQPVPTLKDVCIVHIASGGYHSLALTDKGKLYMWGYARDSQLGVPGLPVVQLSPVEVNFLMDDDGLGTHNVLSVAIGASHALCLVSSYEDQEN
ncbi:RCC1 domain-containing protein RUG3, mitochondrial isoform X2 [Cornus florida]|uniref:RCC1 domain-containing protein RUG3, mitochondrial isoform X2 n=1 Tax=Cornus florida TaxID=4283 RepID=UPI002896B3F9|nr:RCC1 domain-containing protein RUG3, mitochondrial isoform X2 [Cornus florida]